MGSTRHARARRATAWIGAISVVVGMVAVAGPALARPDGPPPPPPPRRPGAATATTQLAIPPVLELRRVGGVANVDLEARSGTVVRGGRRLRTAGYNGVYLAPTIRVARGERVQFHVKDSMAESTTVHWHGLHVPAAGDGGPYQPIEPGATWSPAPFTIKQAATTLWYHPHLMGQTERQVSAGMAGFLLIDDPASAAQAALPHTYGVDDIPLLVQPLPSGGPGPASRDMAVNGSPNAELRTTKSRLRLRLVNASSGEMLRITVAGAKASWQVGSDGGLLEAPFATREVRLGPSERAELVVDVDAGQRVQLLAQSFAGPPGPGGRAGRPLLTIRNTAPTTAARAALPGPLATLTPFDLTGAVQRTMVLGPGLSINGHRMTMLSDMPGMDMGGDGEAPMRVHLGDTEVWTITNPSRQTHAFHVHDVQFQVLDRNGAAPSPGERGRKDTVHVAPGERVRIAMRFADYADPDTPYMFHCHVLRHEDGGMMGEFVVVDGDGDGGDAGDGDGGG